MAHQGGGGMLTTRRAGCDSMHRLFIDELRALYDAELELIEALPTLIAATHSRRLREACIARLELADRQVKRLEAVLDGLALARRRHEAIAARDLITSAIAVARGRGDLSVRDAALIAALQEIGHLAIAGYGTARTWALHLGLGEAADLLRLALDEERIGDRRLTGLAESGINAVATYVTEAVDDDARSQR
jgi:ferritin-like metal-binding protein YciE